MSIAKFQRKNAKFQRKNAGKTQAKHNWKKTIEVIYDAKFDGESEFEVGISKKCVQIHAEGGQPLGG